MSYNFFPLGVLELLVGFFFWGGNVCSSGSSQSPSAGSERMGFLYNARDRMAVFLALHGLEGLVWIQDTLSPVFAHW